MNTEEFKNATAAEAANFLTALAKERVMATNVYGEEENVPPPLRERFENFVDEFQISVATLGGLLIADGSAEELAERHQIQPVSRLKQISPAVNPRTFRLSSPPARYAIQIGSAYLADVLEFADDTIKSGEIYGEALSWVRTTVNGGLPRGISLYPSTRTAPPAAIAQ